MQRQDFAGVYLQFMQKSFWALPEFAGNSSCFLTTCRQINQPGSCLGS